MTNAIPINGELGGYSLTWQCRPALDFPREAIECFQEGVEQSSNRRCGSSAGCALPQHRDCTKFRRSPCFSGSRECSDLQYLPCNRSPRACNPASTGQLRGPLHSGAAEFQAAHTSERLCGGRRGLALREHSGATQNVDRVAQGRTGSRTKRHRATLVQEAFRHSSSVPGWQRIGGRCAGGLIAHSLETPEVKMIRTIFEWQSNSG